MERANLHWLSLVVREAEARKALVDATQPPSPEFRALLRDWWAAVEKLFEFYVRENAIGHIPGNLPLELLNALRGFAGYLAVGNIPDPIAYAASEGSRAPGPTERRDIGLAVAYLIAAREGLEHYGEIIKIDDRTPVKTLCQAYDVRRNTIQGWRKRFPAACPGENPINAEILESLMLQAGERYRFAGRSHGAIRKRRPSN